MIAAPSGFQDPTDIGNRALTHMGADHKLDDLLTDQSKNQREIFGVYTKLRQAELRLNAWKWAIKRIVLRPLDVTSMQWTPAAWSNATTYRVGQVVSYDDGYGARLWVNVSPGNLNNAPSAGSLVWDDYVGQIVAGPYDSTIAYMPGDLVYVAQDVGTYKVYLSLTAANEDDPSTVDAYDATATYKKGDIVVDASINYISLVDFNKGNTPATSGTQWATTTATDSTKWVEVGGTLAQMTILYPINAGPRSSATSLNAYPLPYNFLRKASQDPKAGSMSFLGAPTNIMYDDWLIEGGFIVTQESQPIIFRFVADLTNVTRMDALFCEGFAARIARETCESITQSTAKLQAIGAAYSQFMRQARLVNGIEEGADEQPLDDWLACRI
jgi:hypothetical protein